MELKGVMFQQRDFGVVVNSKLQRYLKLKNASSVLFRASKNSMKSRQKKVVIVQKKNPERIEVSKRKMLDSRKRKRRHPPHFFKVYLPSFSSKRLKIPSAFLKHMKGVTFGTCTLIGPSKKIWNVSLRQHTDGCFFEQGWPVFVSDHSVETGDFFVFRYEGDLQFKVQLFGRSTFEKKSAFEATCSQQHIRVDELDDPTHEAEDLEADSVTKEAEDLEADSVTKEAEDLEACVYRTPIKTLQKGSKKHQGRTKRRYLSSEADSGCETETTKHATKRRYLSWGADSGRETKHARKQGSSKPQRRCITEEEKARVIEAANAFKSKNPFTIVVLRPSYVYHGFSLSLPSLFWKSHLSKCNQEMTLWDQSGRAWPVKYITRGGFSGGWGALARHHNLEADDVCIFELIKAKEMRVHIFRAVT